MGKLKVIINVGCIVNVSIDDKVIDSFWQLH